MRTFEEMVSAAHSLRKRLLNERRDPLKGVFIITEQERDVIFDRPPFNAAGLALDRTRFCGLQIQVIKSYSLKEMRNDAD